MNFNFTFPYSGLIYQGIIAICILLAYFYIEPKYYKNSNAKQFFSSRNICNMIIAIPFAEFIVGFLWQSDSCASTNFFCVSTPDIFKHSLYYDIFYLRVNDTYNGAHWIDYMLLPVVFFITFWLTKDAFFSALNSGFMVFIHESIWFAFYWVKYYQAFQYEGWLNDYAFFFLVSSFFVVAFFKYRKYYANPILYSGIVCYVSFLIFWLVTINFEVTVINNTQLGNALKFLITKWYYLPLPNEYEVISWLILAPFFIEIAVYAHIKDKISKVQVVTA